MKLKQEEKRYADFEGTQEADNKQNLIKLDDSRSSFGQRENLQLISVLYSVVHRTS